MTKWTQQTISLRARSRGAHLITDEIEDAIGDLRNFQVGIAHIFLMHTSAALSINENADPDVRLDMETMLNRIVPEGQDIRHTIEGPDDMPAHVKSSLIGASLSIPIRAGRFVLGTWQGIYLCEFRNRGGSRSVTVTLCGD